MKAYVNKVTGIDDALVSLLMSKRSYTREKELEIRKFYNDILMPNGQVKPNISRDELERFMEDMNKLYKWGVKYGHTTLIRYIDVSITVEGLHRGAQDDLDSHAKRMDNRIVRSSTRLATYDNNEKSDYYSDKILFPFEAYEKMGLYIPKTVIVGDLEYVKTAYGYIQKGLENNNDVKRGLYPLSIPSNCIFKVQLPELAHIYQFRCNHDGHANPELIDCVEMIRESLGNININFANWLLEITQDKPYK